MQQIIWKLDKPDAKQTSSTKISADGHSKKNCQILCIINQFRLYIAMFQNVLTPELKKDKTFMKLNILNIYVYNLSLKIYK